MSTSNIAISFGSASTVVSNGGRGPVAVNSSGQVVVVTLTDTAIVYRVGTCDPNTGLVQFTGSTGTVYKWGNVAVANFDIAMQSDGNQVVVVFQIGGGANELYYITGTLSGSEIQWNTAVQFDTGANPSVTISGNTVIEVHNTQQNPQQTLYYHMGTLSNGKISNFVQKGTKFQAFDWGIMTTSCWLTSADWLLITVTGGPDLASEVYYFTEANINGALQSRERGWVANGIDSDVVLAQAAFEVHCPNSLSTNATNIFLTQGTLDWQGDGSIQWNGDGDNTNIVGAYPHISAAGQFLVMTYMSIGDSSGNTMAVFSKLPA